MKILLVTILAFTLSSCAIFHTKVADAQPYRNECSLNTKSLDLDVSVHPLGVRNGCSEKCLILPAIVSTGSFIVSGSVMLTNNSLHWLEYQGRCKLGLGKHIEDEKGSKVEIMDESCILECDIQSGQCECTT